MKKLIIGLVAALTLVSLMAVPVFAAGKDGPAGNSNIGHLYLYEKDASTWEIVENGAWGKMTYNLSGETFDLVFNGKGLDAREDYSLIYYADPWPGTGGALLASGIANNGGNLNLKASEDVGNIPVDEDANKDGGKIWLVLTADYDADAGKMTAWNPTKYLFENALITFDAD